jgi:hypothetical protein
MKPLWFLAALYSQLFVVVPAGLGTEVPEAKVERRSGRLSFYSTAYDAVIRKERRQLNRRSNLEMVVGGSLAFALGTYGYYSDPRLKTAGKLIYSVTQSGGILALSNGIVGLNASSPLIALDDAFTESRRLSYEEYKRIVVISTRASELAEIKKTSISAGLLGLLYGYNAYLERKSNPVLRNTFGFLAFNFMLFSGASFYRWATFEDFSDSFSQIRPNISLALGTQSSFSVSYTYPLK